MATAISFNGQAYSVPARGDSGWGTSLSAYLIAISTGSLQKSGGSFTLTADIDFGASFGLKAIKYTGRSTPATTGLFRAGNNESIAWRNAGNSADLALKVNASNILEFNGAPITTLALGAADTVLRMNAGGTATEYAKLVNANIDAAAAIAYSKLALTGSIVNADINTSAAIARTKIASGSNNHVIINDGSGVLSSEAALAITRGGSGQATANTALNAFLPTQASNSGKVLSTDGSNSSWVSVTALTGVFADNAFAIQDSVDITKQFKVDAAGTTGTASTLQTSQTTNKTQTLPDKAGTLAMLLDTPVHNIIINGGMDIAQRGTSFTSVGTGTFTIDRFGYYKNGAGIHTVAQVADAPTVAQAGYNFVSSYKATVTTANASPGAGNYNAIAYQVEGLDYQKIHAQDVRLQFWVKSSLTGIHSVGFYNTPLTRTYVTEYTINSANTWELKTIDLTMDSSGTWAFNNTSGLAIQWSIMCGSTNTTSTLNSWQTATAFASTNQVNGVGTLANTWQITGVALFNGKFPSGTTFPFRPAGNTYAHELTLCQRYYEKSYDQGTALATTTNVGAAYIGYLSGFTNTNALGSALFKVNKRTTPTVVIYSTTGATANIRYNSGDVTVSTTPGENGVVIVNNSGGTLGTSASAAAFQYTASAEF